MNTQPKAQAVEAVPKAENNRRFRELIKDNVWTQVEVLARFNKGMVRPVSMSAIKSWLSDPQSVRFRPMAAPLLAHAEKVLTRVPPKASTKN